MYSLVPLSLGSHRSSDGFLSFSLVKNFPDPFNTNNYQTIFLCKNTFVINGLSQLLNNTAPFQVMTGLSYMISL